jgi:hypothetical protein
VRRPHSGEPRRTADVGAGRRRALAGVVCIAALATAVGAAPAGAQVIRGRILDEANGAPVSMAGVFLLDGGRAVVTSALADSVGRYVLQVPETGEYILRVQRLGYFETESPLVAVSADRPYDVDLTLRGEPIRIEGLEVEVPFERQNSWAKERLRYMDPRWGDGDPAAGYGFRLITGLRLEEARLRSDDSLDLLRWVYVPIYDGLDGMCVQTRPNFNRGGGLRAMEPKDVPPAIPQCARVYLDGQPLQPQHVAGLDYRSINAVMMTGGTMHLMTHDFEQRFQEQRRR